MCGASALSQSDPQAPRADAPSDERPPLSWRNEAARLDLIAVAGETRAAVLRDTLERTADDLARTRARLATAEATVEQDGHEIAFRDLQLAEKERWIVERDAMVAHLRGYQTAYETIISSRGWRAVSLFRAAVDKVPPPLRRALRGGLKAAFWAATPWAIPARLQRRRDHLAALQAPLPPVPIPEPVVEPPPPPPPPAPPPPPPEPEGWTLADIDAPRAGYLPLIEAFDPIAPDVSVIVLNGDGRDEMEQCLQHLWQHTSGHHYEIVVVDNGSPPPEVERLRAEAPLLRVVALGGRRYPGEAFNIGAEAAKGRLLCFLDSRTFVTPGWLPPLVAALEHDRDVGVVGPRILAPDGTPQPGPARLAPDGALLPDSDPQDDAPHPVDLVPRIGMLLRRRDFIGALGFDLAWEPAGYEDADLCLKLRLRGLGALACPASAVISLPDSPDRPAGPDALAMNRGKFTNRWGNWLRAPDGPAPELIPAGPPRLQPTPPAAPERRVVIYSPYQLTPGGGERYILTIAEALKDVAAVALVTPLRVSRLRLLTMAREFELDLDQLELLCAEDLPDRAPADIAFLLGNEIFPTVGQQAAHNIYICQFPFPFESDAARARQRPFWDDVDLVLTYSDYVSTHLRREIARADVPFHPLEVLAPPVPMIRTRAAKRPGQILHVGRFFVGGHCKRQDALIEAVRQLQADGVAMELHLAGSVMPEPAHQAYYAGLLEQAAGLPVHFHANCSVEELHRLYAESDLYWHATGVGRDVEAAPYLVEHFGISIVEAMSARCIPLVFAAGGPVSIVEPGVTGFHYRTIDELAARTATLLRSPDPAAIDAMREAAARAAAAFDEETFRAAIRALVARWPATPRTIDADAMQPEGAAPSL